MKFLCAILCCSLLISRPVLAQQVLLNLRSEVVLDADNVKLPDLAEIQYQNGWSTELKANELKAKLNAVNLAQTPLNDQVISLFAAEIKQRLKRDLPEVDFIFSGSKQVRIRRELQEYDVAELQRSGRAYWLEKLQAIENKVEIELDLQTSLVAPRLPRLPLTVSLRSDEKVALPQKRLVLWLDFWYQKKLLKTLRLEYQLKFVAEAFVAKKRLEAGAQLDCAELQRRVIDWPSEFSGLAFKACEAGAAKFKLKRAVLAGQALALHDVVQASAVSAGEEVSLLLRQGSILLETTAIALESGERGSTIPVKPKMSREAIKAKVVEIGKVEYNGS